MATFEYMRINLNTHPPRSSEIELLNAAGSQGWRLVCITGNMMAYLMREVRSRRNDEGA